MRFAQSNAGGKVNTVSELTRMLLFVSSFLCAFAALPTNSESQPSPIEKSAQSEPSDAYYALDRVLNVDIEISPTGWDSLRAQTRTLADILGGTDCLDEPANDIFSWFNATVTVDGETHTDVAVRKKGFLGSLSMEKPSLKIRFDKFVDDQLLGGVLKRLTLNNAQQDPSMINTCLSYRLFAQAGIPTPRCNFATLHVNGEDMGLYVQVESIKTRFLERNFADPTGNLYEGTLSDFRPDWRGTFEKKTNEGTRDQTDIDAVTNALQDPSPAGLAALKEMVDIDRFLTFWALEVLVGHWDGYSGNRNNFYIYREPNSPFVFIPWGTDQVFTTIDVPFDEFRSPTSVAAHGAIAHRLYQNDETRGLYIARLKELMDTIWNEEDLLQQIDRMAAIVQEHASEKVRDQAARDTERVRQFIRGRRAAILADLDPDPPSWPWPLTAADICWPELGSFDIYFETTWNTIQSEDPLNEGRSRYDTYELSGKTPRIANTGVTAGIEEDDPQNANINFYALTPEDNLDILIVSLPLNMVRTSASANIEGLHLTLAPPYIFPSFNGFVGKGQVTFDEAGTQPGYILRGRAYGALYGRDETDYGSNGMENSDGASTAAGELIINELAAKGDPLDWVELYNVTGGEIDLAGYVIADDLNDESKRVAFPEGLVIQPGQYLQIELDKKSWPGFALGSDEELGIWTRDGTLVDQINWEDGQSPKDHSLARIPDISGPFQTVEDPTPKMANSLRTAVFEGESTAPTSFNLHGNWPNPFNAATVIGFDLPQAQPLYLTIYDVLGRPVRQLHAGEVLSAGIHKTIWNGRDQKNRLAASGIYIYRIFSNGIVHNGRMVLIR